MALILFGASASNQVYRQGTTGGLANTPVTADAAGSTEVFSNPARSYLLRIPFLVQSAAIASGSTIFSIHNGNSLTMRFKRIDLALGFAGVAAATESNIQLIRWSAASGTNMTGGTALTPVKRVATMAVSTVADARFNYAAALGVVGVTFEADAFAERGAPRQLVSNSGLVLLPPGIEQFQSVLQLAPNEGIAFRLGIVGVIGDIFGGVIEWVES